MKLDDIEVYKNANFTESLGTFDWGKSTLSKKANDQIRAIIVRDGKWRLYADADYKGFARTYGRRNIFLPGKYVLHAGLITRFHPSSEQINSLVRQITYQEDGFRHQFCEEM